MLKNSPDIIKEQEVLKPSIFESIIKTLLYFDIFNYPLKRDEIHRFLGLQSDGEEIQGALQILLEKEYIYQFNEFISIQNKRENIVRRIQGNELANKMLPLAKRKADLIGKFPFVTSVMASGSLSKGFMDADSDLDFFIITKPGRLWIARMLLVIYKRVFLKNSHKYFCVNYFISSDKLEIEEKNQFTATELATVIPLYNQSIYFDLLQSNVWLTRFYPNFVPRGASARKEKIPGVKKILERLINACGGTLIDEWCMKITYRRWVKVYKEQYSKHDFNIAFKTRKYASKNHPKHYQKKVTEILDGKWKEYSQHYNLEEI